MIVLGELINSTRKSVQKALAEKDEATIRRLAQEQVEAGADIIDINTATSMEKEIEDKIGQFYPDAVEQSKSLMADVPRAFALIARKRGNRVAKLKSL